MLGATFARCCAILMVVASPAIGVAQITKPPQVRIFGTWWPAASDGFSPRETFPLSRDAMWSSVIGALGTNGIAIDSMNPATGSIVTAFQYPDAGRQTTNVITTSRRFRYRIQVEAIDPTHTHVALTPQIESGAQLGWNRQAGRQTGPTSPRRLATASRPRYSAPGSTNRSSTH